ncbi:SAM-dependent methyltransferase [Ruegeria arenilitoris]|uniref:SAM-dependent methyltransferase n=1 Tax=Ruegeria arenilitoris TaxID=1173585 RepID=UPI001481C8A8|nr:cyclopropane-fatty-acyl-phospholipid synthase family protein [Ruegeria arenilitoris]
MWQAIFDRILSDFITRGTLRIRYPDGSEREYGDGTSPAAQISLHEAALLPRMVKNPEMAFGEGYMDGSLSIDEGGLENAMRIAIRSAAANPLPIVQRIQMRAEYLMRPLIQRNSVPLSKRNVAHHYDLSDDFYRLMLDPDMQYSCAYFQTPDMTLEEAQKAKKDHIARKLCLEPGMRVLDIGCGWGGLALTLAQKHGVQVTGLTLSENQHRTANQRIQAAGLQKQIQIRLMDYREVEDQFDRIVSVGMLEHVGAPQFQTYFDRISDLLHPEGVALIHSIGRNGPATNQSPWLSKYIFPGGYVPSLTELVGPVSRTGMWFLDIESLRLHYAKTLRCWRDRFEHNLDQVRAMYDDRFIRMWRFYLTACILVFEERDQTVFQLQLGHKRDVVPLTRDYLYQSPQPMRDAAE